MSKTNQKEKEAVIEVYDGQGNFEGLVEEGFRRPWITTPEKAKAFILTIDERYQDRYKVKKQEEQGE